jgi:Uma2 family endonuclease
VVTLFATLKNIRIVEFTNTSFRKVGLDEFQPDLAFYLGSGLRVPPETNSPVDLNEYDPPTLVVEIGASSLSDDLGWKRLLYERAGVQEYWVNDANARRAIAFAIAEGRSGEIQESQVLPGLAIAIVEEALQRSQTQDDGEINRWLLQTFIGLTHRTSVLYEIWVFQPLFAIFSTQQSRYASKSGLCSSA